MTQPSVLLFLYRQVRAVWMHDREVGCAGVEVPDALMVKYPDLGRRWGWFWVSPQLNSRLTHASRIERRHHLYEERLQRAIKLASAAAQIVKPVSRGNNHLDVTILAIISET